MRPPLVTWPGHPHQWIPALHTLHLLHLLPSLSFSLWLLLLLPLSPSWLLLLSPPYLLTQHFRIPRDPHPRIPNFHQQTLLHGQMIRLPEPSILGVSESEHILYFYFPLMYLLLGLCICCGRCIFETWCIMLIINEMDCLYYFSIHLIFCVCLVVWLHRYLTFGVLCLWSSDIFSFWLFHWGQCHIQLGVGKMIT